MGGIGRTGLGGIIRVKIHVIYGHLQQKYRYGVIASGV